MAETPVDPETRRIAFAATRQELWTANGSVAVYCLPRLEAPDRSKLPRNHEVAGLFPEAGIAFTASATAKSERTELACVPVG